MLTRSISTSLKFVCRLWTINDILGNLHSFIYSVNKRVEVFLYVIGSNDSPHYSWKNFSQRCIFLIKEKFEVHYVILTPLQLETQGKTVRSTEGLGGLEGPNFGLITHLSCFDMTFCSLWWTWSIQYTWSTRIIIWLINWIENHRKLTLCRTIALSPIQQKQMVPRMHWAWKLD